MGSGGFERDGISSTCRECMTTRQPHSRSTWFIWDGGCNESNQQGDKDSNLDLIHVHVVLGGYSYFNFKSDWRSAQTEMQDLLFNRVCKYNAPSCDLYRVMGESF